MEVELKLIKTVDIWPNEGQISGLPKNPRFIKDERFEKLVKSIIDAPEMLALRELLVTPYANAYVAIAGNMRLRASIYVIGMPEEELNQFIEQKQNDANFNEWFKAISDLRESKAVPCKVLPKDTPIEKLREYTIKDNIAFGSDDFDVLANEWDDVELKDWGFELPVFDDEAPEEELGKVKEHVVKLVIEFSSLSEYNEALAEIKELMDAKYPSATVKAK
ncbi:hypothetical protein [Desertivirga xinjiangensis]|uniref:hypothetical protein n=1 Tax=Desertivirga xinjiangensis TaxID=539206 RepID=UPI00210CA98D|nr:hypothetical protein [Pedobacter xinjiangensis]